MERLAGILIIFCLLLLATLPSFVYHLGSGLVHTVHQLLFAWETRGWDTVESDHFLVKYQEGAEEIAVLTLKEAERVYYPLGQYFGCFPDKKVPIAIYQDRASLNRVFGWRSDEGAMGVYWAGVIRLLSPDEWLGEIPSNERDALFCQQGPIAHEYIHFLVDYQTRGNYPRWLTEGLAQFGERQLLLGVQTMGVQAEEGIDLPLQFSLDELNKNFDDSQWQDYCYAVSEDLVMFLINNYGESKLPLLLNELGRGSALDTSFKRVYGLDTHGFIEQYESRFNQNV
ncbi:MAG: hypothetical protein WBJ83_05360 [Thermacetogeniaceae bacterium]|nr:hypothetical protein [Syntrophomonadaceae bacterium]